MRTIVEGKDILISYREVRTRSVELAAPLKKEDFVPQPALFASPPKWHLAHITWFFEEFLLDKHLEGYQRFDSQYSFLFNSYYNTIGKRTSRQDRGVITRPGVEEVMAYRKYVDKHMEDLIQSKGDDHNVSSLLDIGLNHEQQHQELFLTDLKFSFSRNPLYPAYIKGSNLLASHNERSDMITIPEGLYEIGYDGQGFCFDNELGRHKSYVHEFNISQGLVTNGEFLEFIEAGGYQEFSLWLDEGWAWVEENNIECPLYWIQNGSTWSQFTLDGLQALDPKAILGHVNFYEAEAYARWKGMRLPTEFEWEVASAHIDWGQRWEWTNSAYLPYPGFRLEPGAIGEYNGKFMVNQMVLRGASVATAQGHSRKSYRNFFHPHYRWQYSGIRLAK